MLTKFLIFKNGIYPSSLSTKYCVYFNLRLFNTSGMKKPEVSDIPEPIPGIKVAEFLERRNTLIQVLMRDRTNFSKAENHMIIIPAAANGATPRPNADLTYLTGIVDQSSILILLYQNRTAIKAVLFHEPEEYNIKLVGGYVKPDLLKKALKIDEMYPLTDISIYLNSLFRFNQYKLWFDEEGDNAGANFIVDRIKTLPGVYSMGNPAKHLQNMRLIKSPAEVNVLRKTCNITSQAFNSAMAASKPGLPAEIIRTIIEEECQECGANDMLVSVNNNKNNTFLGDRVSKSNVDMVVADAGCEYNGYTAGMSRTWPVSGEFSPRQKLLYNGIYHTQQKLIKGIASGRISTLGQLNDKMRHGITKALQHMGFKKNATAYEISQLLPTILNRKSATFTGMRERKPIYRKKSTPLLPGMVLSLKPGLFIGENRYDIASHYRGLSVQLQDNILIKPNGVEVLSRRCAEAPIDIQQTVGKDAFHRVLDLKRKKKCKQSN